jgi:quercetin dioxygenase-like cupin family protein
VNGPFGTGSRCGAHSYDARMSERGERITSQVTADSDVVRVTTWTFGGAGAATGRHRHQYDYVVVPVTGGTFTIRAADGAVRTMTQVAGVAYLGTAGTAHDVVCASADETVFVEIELKHGRQQ